MRIKRTAFGLATSVALLAALTLQAQGAQGAAGAVYRLDGTYASTPLVGCTIGSDTCILPTYSYDATATCVSACRNAPAAGSVELRLTGVSRLWPPDTCVSREVEGELTFTSTDVNFPTDPLRVRVRGSSVDGRGYSIRSFPNDPVRPVSGFVGFPTDPVKPRTFNACISGSFAGDIYLPPSPI